MVAALVLTPVALWLTLGPWVGGAAVFAIAVAIVVFAIRSDPGGLPSLAHRRRAERREVERRGADGPY